MHFPYLGKYTKLNCVKHGKITAHVPGTIVHSPTAKKNYDIRFRVNQRRFRMPHSTIILIATIGLGLTNLIPNRLTLLPQHQRHHYMNQPTLMKIFISNIHRSHYTQMRWKECNHWVHLS